MEDSCLRNGRVVLSVITRSQNITAEIYSQDHRPLCAGSDPQKHCVREFQREKKKVTSKLGLGVK